MPSVLDQLAVELSLDPAKFIEGLKKTLEASQKGQQQIIKNAQNIEDHTKKATESIGKLSREFQSFFSVIGGALGAAAIKSFVDNIATAEAAIGRMAANLGTTPQALSAWGYAVERVGGNAQAAQASIGSLRERVFNFTNFGEDLGTKFWVGLSRGGVKSDFLRTKDPVEQMYQIGRAIQNINTREGRAQAYSFGKSAFGLDEGSINLIIEAGSKLRETIQEISKTVTPRDADIEAAKRLKTAWAQLTQTVTKLADIIVTNLEPPLRRVLEMITKATENVISQPPAGMEMDPNQTFGDALTHGPHYVPKRNRILKPGQSWFKRNFNPEYIDDPNSPGGAESPSAPTPQTAPAHPWGQGQGGLDRSRFRTELEQNPALREKFLAISLGENQNPNANLAVLETTMNRAAMMGTPLSQEARTTGEGGYYAGYNPGALRNPRLRAMAEANLERALNGSNQANYATDNASQAWGWNRMHGMYGMDYTAGGEYFGHPVQSNARGWNRWKEWKDRAASGGISTPAYWADPNLYGSAFSQRTSTANSYSQSTSSMFLNGPITVNTQATNAEGFARDLRPAIEQQTQTYMSNDGAH